MEPSSVHICGGGGDVIDAVVSMSAPTSDVSDVNVCKDCVYSSHHEKLLSTNNKFALAVIGNTFVSAVADRTIFVSCLLSFAQYSLTLTM